MNKSRNEKRCGKCALPDTFPGIQINKDSVCNYCDFFATYHMRQKLTSQIIIKEFVSIIEQAKKLRKKYDCLICYSGGKDSTYLLYDLKERYRLRMLAYTLDNGFLSDTALKNISVMPDKLDVDHVVFKPRMSLIKKIFRNALTQPTSYPKELMSMMSPLCATCQGIVVGVAINLAKEKDIPLVFIGYTPAQYPNISYENFLKAKSCLYFSGEVHKDDPVDILKIIKDPVEELCGEEISNYYFASQYLKEKEQFPKIIFPFHSLLSYDERKIYKTLKKLGWERPDDTDPCSTNCLINTVGNYACVQQFGYHPYICEMSFSVRAGTMTYKEAIDSERIDENSHAMKCSLRKLGLTKNDIKKRSSAGKDEAIREKGSRKLSGTQRYRV